MPGRVSALRVAFKSAPPQNAGGAVRGEDQSQRMIMLARQTLTHRKANVTQIQGKCTLYDGGAPACFCDRGGLCSRPMMISAGCVAVNRPYSGSRVSGVCGAPFGLAAEG